MNFRDLIEKYKQGIASEEEIEIIEQEIEKFEVIEEYLDDNIELDFISPVESTVDTNDSGEIQKSVNKRLRKVALTSVSIILALLFSIFYILSPLVDNMYYNPNKTSVGDGIKDLVYDLRVFTELNLPGYHLSFPTHAENLGFGKYNVYLGRTKKLTQERDIVNMKIERGRLFSSDKSLYPEHFVYFPTYINPESFDKESIERNNERVMNHLKELNPVSYVAAYLTFERDLTMEELYQLQWDYSVKFIWAGIRTEAEEEMYKTITGFSLENNSGVQLYTPDAERYPAFNYYEWLDGKHTFSNQSKAYELHYKSLLKYMIDREKAVLTLEGMPTKYDYYKSALEYVEENGVNTFGVLVFANPEDLIELVENGTVENFGIDEVMASKRYVYW